jgi:putative transposase
LRGGRKPETFNTDQGSQYTSEDHTSRLMQEGIRVSMDGRGRALDNAYIERLWRTVKYEEVYLKDYATVPEAIAALRNYFRFYNQERLHQALEYRTPQAVYLGARN